MFGMQLAQRPALYQTVMLRGKSVNSSLLGLETADQSQSTAHTWLKTSLLFSSGTAPMARTTWMLLCRGLLTRR